MQLIFQEWVRGQVVLKYTLIDEYLSVMIVSYYFPKPAIGHYGKLWRTKPFQLFNYRVLDELYLLKKKDFANAIRPLPPGIAGKIMKINDVRNAVAHSYFPQNRRRYHKQGGLLYDGADLFTKAGVEKFLKDANDVLNVLYRRSLPLLGSREGLPS